MRILIAEDEADDVLYLYKCTLEQRGHTIVVAHDGEEGLKAYEDSLQLEDLKTGNTYVSNFDVVVLDYSLPKKDGMEVAKSIFKLAPRQRIIIASASVKDALVESLNKLNRLVELIQKPFELRTLVDKIEEMEVYAKLQEFNVNIEKGKGLNLNHEQLLELTASSFSDEHSSESLKHVADPKISGFIKMMVETASAVDQEIITQAEGRKSLKPEQIFSVLSDDLTIKILKSALIGFPADYYWKELGITRKQYYDRLHKLRQIDLVRRKNNIYKVTALGEIIVHIVLGTVEEVVTNYWRLKVLESFQHTIPPEERIRIINLMLSNTKIKEYLL